MAMSRPCEWLQSYDHLDGETNATKDIAKNEVSVTACISVHASSQEFTNPSCNAIKIFPTACYRQKGMGTMVE